jgi:phage tail-like protein
MTDAGALPPAPPSASARGYLTGTLPSVYTQDERPSLAIDWRMAPAEPFVVRWLNGLEQVLDPVVALVDNLAWHFDSDLAPDDLVREMLIWLGLGVAADLEPEARRRVLRRAIPLGRGRGTLAGLRELLAHAFGALRIEVTHSGRATRGPDPLERPAAAPPRLEVRCRAGAPTPEQEVALRALVAYACPLQVEWTLEIGERGSIA